MKINKKILLLLTASLITLSLTACSSNKDDNSNKSNEEITNQQEVEETNTEEDTLDSEDTSSENANPFGNIMEKPVMNGSKTERIGTYAEVMVGGIEITEANLVEFYNEVVEDSDYNWVTMNIDGETGIQFPGSSYFFTYGSLDNEGCIVEGKGDGTILDGKVDYTSK